MNIPRIEPIGQSTDQIPTNQQSAEQTILLNAIKNKFANNNDNYAGTSPPVFSIPCLKLPQFTPTNSLENGKSLSKLNQFLMGQLSESQNQVNRSPFEIPNLQCNIKPGSSNLTLAEKLNLKSESNIVSLNDSIRELRVSDEIKPQVIDLTTALNKMPKLATASPSRQPAKPNPIDFQIPFIDCDLRETAARLPLVDEYCQKDVCSFVGDSFISRPTMFGKIMCLRYRLPKRTLHVDHSFKTRHTIKRFCFDTKSPDDIILATLRKFSRI